MARRGRTASQSVGDADLTTLERASAELGPADIGRLRRERRRLLKTREQSIRDLGGLTVEMVRRNAFKPDLLTRRARDILGLEDGVHDIEDALTDARDAAASRRSRKQTGAVSSCEFCSAALPGGAHFCPTCGTATETTHESPAGAGW